MKILATLLFIFSAGIIFGQKPAQEINLKGVYNGKNLILQNPMTPSGNYSLQSISVNDEVADDHIASPFVEIDLGGRGLKEGDALTITLKHAEGYALKVMNPEVISKELANVEDREATHVFHGDATGGIVTFSNPKKSNGERSVTKVLLNEKELDVDLSKNEVSIDMANHEHVPGASIDITLKCNWKNPPKLLTPETLKPHKGEPVHQPATAE